MQARIQKALAKRQAGEGGFTLIELLVVIVIIGILAAIAIPAFLNQREKAWQKAVESDLRNLAMQIETDGVDETGAFTTANVTAVHTAFMTNNSANVNITVPQVSGTGGAAGTGTGFSMVGTHNNLTGSQTYDSTQGGVQAWTP